MPRRSCRSRCLLVPSDRAIVGRVEPFAKAVLVTAIVIGLSAAPAAAFLLWYAYPLTWRIELEKFQTLAGALVALLAASLAATGVLLTIMAQRREQRRSRLIARQHVASAFIGEIGVITEELAHELVGPALRKALNDVESGSGKVQVTTVRLTTNPRYYNNNPGNVGLFPNLLPQELTRFYSRLEAFSAHLNAYSAAAEHALVQDTLPPTTSTQWILYSIKEALEHLDFLLEHGRKLITELEAIRNENLD
jgi:membrane protein implicated in regulation of membrane protease activity